MRQSGKGAEQQKSGQPIPIPIPTPAQSAISRNARTRRESAGKTQDPENALV